MGRFTGKTAIITGSSNGIGRGIAVLFAKEGAQLTITGRNDATLNETKRQCLSTGLSDDGVLSVLGDFQNEKTMQRIVDETIDKFGKIDFLINNAGAGDMDNSGKLPGFLNQDVDSYDYVMNINVRSIVQLTKFAVPYLEKTQGEVVNISSIASGKVGTSYTFYAMSKAALDQLTHSLAIELIPKGIRVNCIKPGMVKSAFMEKQGITQEQTEQMSQAAVSNFSVCPVGFMGMPEDVANLAAFLCDRTQSRYLVGQCITLDGGSSLINPLLCTYGLMEK